MASVLVVGGTSFVAAHLLPKLVASGATVFATHRGGAAPIPGVTWLSADLSSADAVRGLPSHCDAVIYLAQARNWRMFPDGAADVFAINVESVFRALEYARGAGVTRFIFASSGSIYEAGKPAAFESDGLDLRAPRSFYAASKIASEALLRPYADLFRVVVLRLFAPFGPGQASDMLLPRIADSVRHGRPITLQGDDGLRMNPVAVDDVATAIVKCLSLESGATLNVGGRDVVSLRQIADRIGALIGCTPHFDVQAGPSPSVVGDIREMERVLGWTPAMSFDDGLRVWLGATR